MGLMDKWGLTDKLPYWIQGFFRDGKSLGYIKNSYMLGQRGPVWLEVDKPYHIYNTIPQVRAVIDRKAKMFSNMEIKAVNKKGDPVELDPKIKALLQNPNALQSFNDWLEQFKIQEQTYGNQFMYFNKPSAISPPVAIWNISPRYMSPVLTGKLFLQTSVEGIISGYEYNEPTSDSTMYKQTFSGDEIMFSKIADLDSPILGVSPLYSLKFPITNTKLAYEYLNVISGDKGAIGILSNSAKDGAGPMPLSPEEKQEIESAYRNNYGVADGKGRVIITEASLNWQPMSYPTKDLLLLEQIDSNFLSIIDHFGLNANIFSSKNATFENVKQSILLCYQDTIQPEADKFTQRLGSYLGLSDDVRLVASFDHVPFIKESKKQATASTESLLNVLNSAITAGFIDQTLAKDIFNNEIANV